MLPPHLHGAVTRSELLNALKLANVRLGKRLQDGRIQCYLNGPGGRTVHLCFARDEGDGLIDAMSVRLLPEQVVQLCDALGVPPEAFGWSWPREEV